MTVDMSNLTLAQQMGLARDFVGRVIYVRPFEKVLKVSITDTTASVLFETYSFTEIQTRVKFTKRGKRLWTWDRDKHQAAEMVMWEDGYAGEEIALYGKVRTEGQDEFERACYRPGTSNNPLDSYSRIQEGPSAPRMERHW